MGVKNFGLGENTSGQGKSAEVPVDIVRWNWGAFLLNWIWGLGNNTFIALLMFVPLVNFVMPFVLGAKGSEWAWQNKRWESVEEFQAIQRKWARWGFGVLIGLIIFFVVLYFSIIAMMKSSGAYQLAFERLLRSPEAVVLLGAPIESGMIHGNIQVSGPNGSAIISFPVEGPNGKGTAYVDATKDLGAWKINRMELEIEGRDERVLFE